MKIYGLKMQGTPLLATPLAGNGMQLKEIYGAKIAKDMGICFFPAFKPFIKHVQRDLKIKFPNAHYEDNALAIIKESSERELDYKNEMVFSGFDFRTTPFAHQMKSFVHILYHLRSALFLECGLGKSAIVVWLVRYLREKVLILCPPALIKNWFIEFEKYSFPNELKIEALTDKNKTRVIDGKRTKIKVKKEKLEAGLDADILLVGYKTATMYQEEIFNHYDYKIIVADESQKVKGPKSQQTKAALFLASKAYRRVILSGTAVTNSPEDLYSQLLFLCYSLVEEDFWSFCKRFQEYSKWNKHIVVGYKNLDILNKRVSSVAMRYTKEECLDLPDRRTIIRKFDISDKQREVYQNLLNDQTLYLDEGEISKKHKIAIFSKLAQVTGGFLYVPQTDETICDKCMHMQHCIDSKIKPYTKNCAVEQVMPAPVTKTFKENPKLDLFMELVQEITVEPKNKIIAWARHVWELAAIEAALKKAKINYHSLPADSGKVLDIVEDFNNDPTSKILIGQISRGVGFTATSANYAIYYSLSFNLEDYLQSRDRLYRIGQTRKVIEYILEAENTIDGHIIKALELKVDIKETLLASVACFKCARNMQCLMQGTRPWDPDCVVSSKIKKNTLAMS